MDIIVKSVSRVLFPFILLLGIYIAWHGHLSAGGAFAAGAVAATGFALVIIAYSEGDVEYKLTRGSLISRKGVAGAILVILFLNLGYLVRPELMGTQTAFNLWSGGVTIFLNLIGSLMIVTAIVVIVYSLVRE